MRSRSIRFGACPSLAPRPPNPSTSRWPHSNCRARKRGERGVGPQLVSAVGVEQRPPSGGTPHRAENVPVTICVNQIERVAQLLEPSANGGEGAGVGQGCAGRALQKQQMRQCRRPEHWRAPRRQTRAASRGQCGTAVGLRVLGGGARRSLLSVSVAHLRSLVRAQFQSAGFCHACNQPARRRRRDGGVCGSVRGAGGLQLGAAQANWRACKPANTPSGHWGTSTPSRHCPSLSVHES